MASTGLAHPIDSVRVNHSIRRLATRTRRPVDGSLESPYQFLLSVIELLFTARRFASAVLATAIPSSVCLSVCLSIRL